MHQFTSAQLSKLFEFVFDRFICLDSEGVVISCSHNLAQVARQANLQQLFPKLTLQQLDAMRINLQSVNELLKIPATQVEMSLALQQQLAGTAGIRVVSIAAMAEVLPGYLICFDYEQQATADSEQLQRQLQSMKSQLM
ncbi:MAG: hypothetical protein LAT66_05520, partial [Alkalimonas sp.]|nr:hypothetical protein [Alkalimonas sp.]